MEEPTTSPFLPSPSLKPPLSNSALPSQALGGMASGLGMQNLNSSRQVRPLGEGHSHRWPPWHRSPAFAKCPRRALPYLNRSPYFKTRPNA